MHPALLKILEAIKDEHDIEGPSPVLMSMEDFHAHMLKEEKFQEEINKISLTRPWDVCWTQSQAPQ
jgi:hypothetical protein